MSLNKNNISKSNTIYFLFLDKITSDFFPLIFLCRRGLLLQVVLEASQVCNIYWLPHYSYTNPFNVKNANYIVPGVQQPIFSHTTYSKQCFTVFVATSLCFLRRISACQRECQ